MARPSPVVGLGPRSSLAEAATALALARLSDVVSHDRRLGAGLDLEAIHDLRVAIRRLRAVTQLFEPLSDWSSSAVELKTIQDALGAVRDLQLQREWLGRARPRVEARGVIPRVDRAFADAARVLPAAMERWRARGERSIRRAIATLEARGRFGGRDLGHRLEATCRALERPLRRALDGDAERIHQLRIRLKKLRYQLELAQDAFPIAIGAALETLVPVAEALGQLHDVDARAALLRSTDAPAARLLEAIEGERAPLAQKAIETLEQWVEERWPRRLARMIG